MVRGSLQCCGQRGERFCINILAQECLLRLLRLEGDRAASFKATAGAVIQVSQWQCRIDTNWLWSEVVRWGDTLVFQAFSLELHAGYMAGWFGSAIMGGGAHRFMLCVASCSHALTRPRSACSRAPTHQHLVSGSLYLSWLVCFALYREGPNPGSGSSLGRKQRG